MDARGRNGWFKAAYAETWLNARHNPPELWIDIYSRKNGNFAPIHLDGTPQEMQAFVGKLKDIIDSMVCIKDRCECANTNFSLENLTNEESTSHDS